YVNFITVVFFFFQAEDGIRDFHVTGVQTCALPIWEKFQEDLENIHRLFKQFVSRYRPVLNVEEVATGEVWFGTEALQKALADEIRTSDEYISQRIRQADVFEVHFHRPKKLQDRLSSTMSAALDRLLLTWVSRLYNQRFW